MTYSPITALPTAPSRARPSTFSSEADAFLAALSTFRTEVNAAGTHFDSVDVSTASSASTATTKADEAAGSATTALGHANDASDHADAAAASAASVASAWSSGASYSAGTLVYSPIDYQAYRAITTHSGETTDPSEDETNWVVQGSGGGGGLTSQTATTSATTQTAIATYAKADYTGMELTVVADDDTDRTITKLLVVHDGTTAVSTQYGEVNTNTALATYDVDISGANVRLLATPASATSTEFTVKENLFAPVTP